MENSKVEPLQEEAVAAYQKWRKFMGNLSHSYDKASFVSGFTAGKTAGARSVLDHLVQVAKNRK